MHSNTSALSLVCCFDDVKLAVLHEVPLRALQCTLDCHTAPYLCLLAHGDFRGPGIRAAIVNCLLALVSLAGGPKR